MPPPHPFCLGVSGLLEGVRAAGLPPAFCSPALLLRSLLPMSAEALAAPKDLGESVGLPSLLTPSRSQGPVLFQAHSFSTSTSGSHQLGSAGFNQEAYSDPQD